MDPKAQAKELFEAYVAAAKGRPGIDPGMLPEATAILNADPAVQVQFVLLAVQKADMSGVMRFGFETVKWLQAAVSTVLRKNPEMADTDVIALADSIRSSAISFISITGVVGYIERRFQKTAMSADVRRALSDWADTLRQGSSADQRKACERLRALVGIDPARLITPEPIAISPEPIDLTDADLKDASDHLSRFMAVAETDYRTFSALGQPAGREIRDSADRTRAAILFTIVTGRMPVDPANTPVWWLMRELLAQNLPYSTHDFTTLLGSLQSQFIVEFADDTLYEMIHKHIGSYGLSPSLRTTLFSLRDRLAACCYHPAIRPHVGTINGYLGEDGLGIFEPGDPWVDSAIADYRSHDTSTQSAWKAIFEHAAKLEATQPSKAWSKEAAALLNEVGADAYLEKIERWFPLVAQSRWILLDKNSQVLKGLVWFCAAIDVDGDNSARVDSVISRLAFDCFAKIRGCGQRCAKAGNACVAVLGSRPGLTGVSHLNRLRQRITYQVPQKLIEKALNEAAARAGLTQDDLVEIGVPTFGLLPDGRREEEIGDWIAAIDLTSPAGCTWQWLDSSRNALPSQSTLSDDLMKEFNALNKETAELEQTLADQKVRLENLYLAGREWPLSIWRERYLEHPLVGYHARRLIWEAETPTETVGFMPEGDTLVSPAGEILDLADNVTVRLWHPLGQPEASIAAWCDRIARLKVVQPFKQAHRETYVPNAGEAEMFDTPAGSQRFSGHILRQHQFQKLAQLRGWRYRLQGGWDSANTPYRELPRWGLTASFEVGNDDEVERSGANIDLTVTTGLVTFGKMHEEMSPKVEQFLAAGAGALHVSSERVMKYLANRFVEYRMDPVALRDVPLVVFSEIMRDVDLFVSSCSIGNAPDAGKFSEDPLRSGYWRQFSFGEPTGTVKSRASILSRILPSMPALARCAVEGRHLTIQGQIRRYRIHLGSGAIFMEPGNTALVVKKPKLAAREQTPSDQRLYLPFEGDELLFDILNHALLLSRDDEVFDPALRKQIGKARR